MLRSWVQIPPGPSLSVVQLRYWFEIVLRSCGQKSIEMVMELYFTLQDELRTSQTLQEGLRDISIVILFDLFLELNEHRSDILSSCVFYRM